MQKEAKQRLKILLLSFINKFFIHWIIKLSDLRTLNINGFFLMKIFLNQI